MAVSLERVAAGLAAEGRDLAARPPRAGCRSPRRTRHRGAARRDRRRTLRGTRAPSGRTARGARRPPRFRATGAPADPRSPDGAPRSAALNAGQLRGVIRSTSAGQNHAAHQASATVRQAASGPPAPPSSSISAFLLMDDRRGVVGLPRDAESRRDRRRRGARRGRRPRTAAAATIAHARPGPGGCRRDVGGARAGQAVAGAKVMIEKTERTVGRKRAQPEREPRELDGRRVRDRRRRRSAAATARRKAARSAGVTSARVSAPSAISASS